MKLELLLPGAELYEPKFSELEGQLSLQITPNLSFKLPTIEGWVLVAAFISAYAASCVPFFSILWVSRRILKIKQGIFDLAIHAFVLWGVCILLPAGLERLMGIVPGTKYMVQHFTACCCAAGTFHRVLESALQRYPPGPEQEGFVGWMQYMVLPGSEPKYNEKDGRPVKAPPGTFQRRVLALVQAVFGAIIVASLYPHLPSPSFYVEYCKAALFAAMLSCMSNIGGLALLFLPGSYDVRDMMRAPMVLSQGLNDFWGRRWNTLIHRFLKRLWFAPVLDATGSKFLGALAAFIGSGVFHEALVYYTYLMSTPDRKEAVWHSIGSQSVFFVIQAVLCAVERRFVFQYPKAVKTLGTMPRWMQTIGTCLIALPAAHLFTMPLVRAGLLESIMLHCPRLEYRA